MYDDATLARYLSGECSPEEQLAIRRWLASDAEHQRQLDRIGAAWELGARRTAPTFDVEGMRRRLASRTSGAHRAVRALAPRSSWILPVSISAAVAAAVLVFLTHSDRSRGSRQLARLEQREVVTGRGQKADVYLSDGTHVQLAPESRLRFASRLADTVRDVTLEGRALFEVTHDGARPFRVHTASGVAEDLGTRFDVTQYAGDTVLRVVVAEGLVGLRHVTLKPGDRGTLTISGRLDVQNGVDVAREIGWTTGRVSFDAIPLRDAIRELRRYHDIDFAIADSATGARRLTASFGSEPTPEVVRVIAFSLDLRATTRGKTVTFAPRERP